MLKKHEHFEFLVSECYRNQKLSFSSKDLQKTFETVESRYDKVIIIIWSYFNAIN